MFNAIMPEAECKFKAVWSQLYCKYTILKKTNEIKLVSIEQLYGYCLIHEKKRLLGLQLIGHQLRLAASSKGNV